MKEAIFVALAFLKGITCLSISSEGMSQMENREEGTCHLRVKVMCSKDIDLRAMIGDTFTDPVFVTATREPDAVFKCLPIPCSMPNGKVSGDIRIMGNDIITKPDFLKDIVTYTEKKQCLEAEENDYKFEVGCDGDRISQKFKHEVLTKDNTIMSDEDKKDSGIIAHRQYYNNDWDSNLRVECPNQHGLYRVVSEHDNGREDRRWRWECRRVTNINFDKGYWTPDYVNWFDQPIMEHCPANEFLCGVFSYHDNNTEDRRWKYKCCRSKNHYTRNCAISGFVNWFDHRIDYTVGNGRVMTGFSSYHDNGTEDRRWKFSSCEIKYCEGV